MPESTNLDQSYKRLGLPHSATLEDLEQAYFYLKAEKVDQQRHQEIPALDKAYKILKAHFQSSLDANNPHPSGSSKPSHAIRAALWGLGLNAQVSLSETQLHLQLSDRQAPNPATTVAQIHTWLKNNRQSYPVLESIQSVTISAHRNSARSCWRRIIPMPGARSTFADHDLTSFQSRFIQLFGFPALLLLAIALNAIPIAKFLLRGVTIWFHEFGHATVAWLSGRKAIPLPLGWTSMEPEKSWFVYVGILILLGILGWAGRREHRRWPVILAIALACLQFAMTWLLPTDTFWMLFSFGGIGGEFYLCTLLIVSFFFPFPDYFLWEIYRYPVVLGSAYTFWGSFSLWRQIDRGQQSIPWGTLWGGADHQGGDMNQLSHVFGWSDQQIIDTYNTLGGICLGLILGLYLYVILKNQRSHLVLFWSQGIATYWK